MAFSRRTPVLWLLALIATIISPAIAQTWTACNPMEKECPPHPALSTNYTCDFAGTLNDVIWNTTAGKIGIVDHGAEFTIARRLESPTIQSHFYIFFGRLEVHMRAATGQGIVSSIVLQSETLDEIDWEWVGSDDKRVQSNYYGKGNDTTYDRVGYHDVEDPMGKFHNYTVHWTKEKLEWWIDEKLVRTLRYEEALDGYNYPQTPSTVRLGIWPAGDPKNSEGTIEWAGGEVDYDAGPYTMLVKQLKVEDFSSGKEYEYSDKSGSWESIDIIGGKNSITEEVQKPPPKSLSQKWAELPNGAKIAIYCSIAAVVALGISIMAFCCVKQRRLGRKEYSLEQSKFLSDQDNNVTLRSNWNGGYKQVRGG